MCTYVPNITWDIPTLKIALCEKLFIVYLKPDFKWAFFFFFSGHPITRISNIRLQIFTSLPMIPGSLECPLPFGETGLPTAVGEDKNRVSVKG